jgi:hypothetical protein
VTRWGWWFVLRGGSIQKRPPWWVVVEVMVGCNGRWKRCFVARGDGGRGVIMANVRDPPTSLCDSLEIVVEVVVCREGWWHPKKTTNESQLTRW